MFQNVYTPHPVQRTVIYLSGQELKAILFWFLFIIEFIINTHSNTIDNQKNKKNILLITKQFDVYIYMYKCEFLFE